MAGQAPSKATNADVADQAPSKATDADVAGQVPSKATNAPQQNIFAKCKALLQEGDSAFLAALNYKFPLVKYHDNWKHLKLTTFLQPRGKYHFSNKGMAYANTVKAYPFGNEYMQLSGGKHAMLSEEKLDQFQKIYDLCDKNGIRLVLLTRSFRKYLEQGQVRHGKTAGQEIRPDLLRLQPSTPSRLSTGPPIRRMAAII